MKICGISDIHGNLLENVPECDVLCIAGDVITLNAQRNFDASEYWWKNRFITWVMQLPCKKVIIVPGNHDFYLENLYTTNRWEEFCDYMAINTEEKLYFLIDQSFEYEGIKFYGTPWINPIDFQRNKWAFENYDFNDDNPYSKIPECDVLITHDSPIKNKLLNIESWYKCKYHFYGHWHDGESKLSEGKYNCSRLNDYYSFKKNFEFPTIYIDTTMKKTKYELLQEFANKIKETAKDFFVTFDSVTEEDLKVFNSKIDETFIKFLDNPQDKEDGIIWTESSVITDMDGNNEESIEDEYK